MKLKYGSEVSVNTGADFFTINTYGCLKALQTNVRINFSELKSALFEHLATHYPDYTIERPPHVLEIKIDNRLYSRAFVEYVDEMAFHMVEYQAESMDWTRKGMKEAVAKYPLPQDRLTDFLAMGNEQSTPLLDPNKPIRLPSSLLKKNFVRENSQPVGFGRANADWVFFRSKKNSEVKKTAIVKDSSETSILLSRLFEENDPRSYLYTVPPLLNKQFGVYRDHYAPETILSVCFESPASMVPATEAIIRRLYPYIRTYMNSNHNEESQEKLRAVFKSKIQKERAQAAIGAMINRLLMGPAAPKVRYLNAPGNKDHLKLFSNKISNATNYALKLTTSRTQAYALAPQLAAAALVRLILGCEAMEMKFDNFMAVSMDHQETVVTIDTDWCFETREQAKLNNLTLGNEGARNLCVNRPKAGQSSDPIKVEWDNLFSVSNNAAVAEAMTVTLKRAAAVLTEEMIEHIVDYVMNQEGDEFKLSIEDRKEIVDFLNDSRKIAITRLNALHVPHSEDDPVSQAPWLRNLFEEIYAKNANKNSL